MRLGGIPVLPWGERFLSCILKPAVCQEMDIRPDDSAITFKDKEQGAGAWLRICNELDAGELTTGHPSLEPGRDWGKLTIRYAESYSLPRLSVPGKGVRDDCENSRLLGYEDSY